MCLNLDLVIDFKRDLPVKTFSIETSCDDTSIAIVKFDWKRFEVEKMLSYSQTQEHQKYWWVVPEVASRLHEEKILILLEEFWKENIENTNFISVTAEPGLPGSLIVWLTTAYTLWNFLDKEVVEVNHIHWHIFSLFLERNIDEIKLPMVVLTASGGHNEIYYITRITEDWFRRLAEDKKFSMIDKDNVCNIDKDSLWLKEKLSVIKIWYTLDDAAGEAFDKVARMLGGPYPGGPWISDKAMIISENRSQKISEEVINLINKKIKPVFLSSDKFEFSFSWHKSQVYYLLRELEKRGIDIDENIISYISYRFQESVIEVLGKKLVKAAINYWANTIWISWWVSANDRLFEYVKELVKKYKSKKLLSEQVKVIRPVKKIYSTDNAAMIWVVGIFKKLSTLTNGEEK